MAEDTKKFLELFQTKLNEFKNIKAPDNHVDFLWSMFANMCKVKNTSNKGISLFITPFGVTCNLDNDLAIKSPEDMDYDKRVKRAIIASLENLLFMRSDQLKQLKKGKNNG